METRINMKNEYHVDSDWTPSAVKKHIEKI